MSVAEVQTVLDRYFAAMGAGEDYTACCVEDVSWLMVDSSHEVRGRASVRAYLDTLHGRMLTGEQRGLVVTEGHALLEGSSVNAGDEHGAGFAYCLVYDVDDGLITAMRCYGSLARLMPTDGSA